MYCGNKTITLDFIVSFIGQIRWNTGNSQDSTQKNFKENKYRIQDSVCTGLGLGVTGGWPFRWILGHRIALFLIPGKHICAYYVTIHSELQIDFMQDSVYYIKKQNWRKACHLPH